MMDFQTAFVQVINQLPANRLVVPKEDILSKTHELAASFPQERIGELMAQNDVPYATYVENHLIVSGLIRAAVLDWANLLPGARACGVCMIPYDPCYYQLCVTSGTAPSGFLMVDARPISA